MESHQIEKCRPFAVTRFLADIIHSIVLLAAGFIAFSVRAFSVIKYESIIHEFDPWFNYRVSVRLLAEGRAALTDWFDADAWYPLGRIVGRTLFPGLMYTAVLAARLLRALRFPVDILHVCVFTGPVFAVISTIGAYLMTVEICGKRGAGLFSALFIAVVPSYLSRSVAGSFDNEAVAITQLLYTLYLFLRAAQNGSILAALLSVFSYAYFVLSWGGYHFVALFIPVFTLAIMFVGRLNRRLYIAYNIFYAMGTLYAMQTRYVGLSAVFGFEHLPSHVVFVALQLEALWRFVSPRLSKAQRVALLLRIAAIAVVFLPSALALLGRASPSLRILSIINPTYARKQAPLVASVSEHQPTPWATFFFDFQFLLLLAPAGIFFALYRPTLGGIFISFYAVVCIYVSGLMVRLLLVAAPAVCVLAGIGASALTRRAARAVRKGSASSLVVALAITAFVGWIAARFVLHSTMIGAEVYSSPTVVIAQRNYETGGKHIIDDFRESFYWLRQNTARDAKVLAWWDYGYQIAGFADRPTVCDNNTWNFGHIARVAKIFTAPEGEAALMMEEIGAEYVFLVFGGRSGYSSDDINKFLWMVRIAAPDFPEVRESDFAKGYFRVDAGAPAAFRQSLMYKLSYYRFIEENVGQGPGFDFVRRAHIDPSPILLDNFEEVFSSPRWLVRIYRRKPTRNSAALATLPADLAAYPISYDSSLDPVKSTL